MITHQRSDDGTRDKVMCLVIAVEALVHKIYNSNISIKKSLDLKINTIEKENKTFHYTFIIDSRVYPYCCQVLKPKQSRIHRRRHWYPL
jgi:hypothetical protein